MNALLGWAAACVGGIAAAWVAYPRSGRSGLTPIAAALRAVATIALLALLFDLPIGAAAPPAPLVALDASASWSRTRDSSGWRAAQDSAARLAGSEGVVLFGDSARLAAAGDVPRDAATRVRPAVERAVAAGQPLIVITDGGLDDADALEQALPGSRIVVVPVAPAADRAVVDLNVPAEARAGDTIALQARIVADGAAPAPTTLEWVVGGAVVGTAEVPALAAGGEAVVESRVVVPAGDSLTVLRAALRSGDAQQRNDTVAVAFRRGARQRIVVVSTAPDADVREVVAALRTNSSLPTDAFFRITPGRWLREGSFAPVDEASVRASVRGATLVVLHGDTAVVGAPGSLGARAIFLLAPPPDGAPEVLVRAAPSSPLQSSLAGIVVESLPPLLVTTPARGGVTALSAAPGGVLGAPTPVVSATDGAVRRVLLTASGYSRWRTRGGVSEVAFQSLVGGATDWLLAARGATQLPTLMTAIPRAGAPLRWRRGSQARSVVSLRRESDGAVRRDTLRFTAGPDSVARDDAEQPAVDAGVWRGTVDGTPVVVPVSASAEWIPRRAVSASRLLGAKAVPQRRGARGVGWLYLATVLLLAVEWLLRRRAGLR